MSNNEQIKLSVADATEFAADQRYWDGLAAGVQIAADHAKRLAVQKILDSRKPAPPPVQPDPAPEV